MIYYISGKIQSKNEKFLVVEASNLGYKVFCSPDTLKKVSENNEIQLFTHLYLKEEKVELYGFLTQKELELFETLNEISGIGPKTAMLLSSVGSLEKLKEMMEKDKLPQEIKGIGKKKMQKILLELTGKIKEINSPQNASLADEALDALISLGFPRQKAKDALSQIPPEIKGTEVRTKEALKLLGKSQ